MTKEVYNGMERRNDEHWTFDRRIPIALVVLFIGQVFGFGWLAANMTGDVENNTKSISVLKGTSASREWTIGQLEQNREWEVGEHNVLRSEINSSNKSIKSIKNSMLRTENKVDKMYELLLRQNSPKTD